MGYSKGEVKDIRDAHEPYTRTHDRRIKALGEKADRTGEPRIPGVNYHKIYGGITLPKDK